MKMGSGVPTQQPQTVRLKNSSDIQNKLVKHQLQDLSYTQEILKAQAVVTFLT
jgi:hypothetical protein